MDSSSPNNVAHQRSNQDPLKCPRCNSYNTKFCYYNNYSLSQPRHFCKACKRYWTRGGTLRNVPVGGGCRKNKKAKQQPFNGGGGGSGDGDGDGISSAAFSTATIKSSSAQPDIDLSPTSNRINNPLLFSQPTNPLELNFPFSRFPTTRVSSDSTRFDHQSQIYNGLGIGFSSAQIQDDINPMFFGSSNFATAPMTTSTMASLLASSLQQKRFSASGVKEIQGTNDFPGFMPSEDDMQMLVGNGEIGKEQITEVENRSQWNSSHIEQINSSSDYSSPLFWNTNNNVGAWFDPSNMGSSVPSLI